MASVCFYFQVHQPYRLRRYSMFDIGSNHRYFDHHKNQEVCLKVSSKCYLPMNRLLLDLINRHEGRFRVAFSITGVAVEQFRDYAPEVLQGFQELARTGCVEFLSETYHHSLSYLYSKAEFVEQVRMHRELMEELFGQTPNVFRNTELIYNNELAADIERLGYQGILAEGFEDILGWRSPNFLYRPVSTGGIKTMLKNYKLSDDIAFRFGDKSWVEYPLTVGKFHQWLSAVHGNGHTVNLFMDYETFGEHQWEDSGIFEFMRLLPEEVLKHRDNGFLTPSEIIRRYQAVGSLDARRFVSWADVERDLSAWQGNKLQQAALCELYKLEQPVKATGDTGLIDIWRRLTTSDHFYYMCTKWFADGDVHKYFNPYESPYEAYIAFMNVLQDLKLRTARKVECGPVMAEHPLVLADGQVLNDYQALADALESMPEQVYDDHVNSERNDFARWIEQGFGEHELARHLRQAQSRHHGQALIYRHILDRSRAHSIQSSRLKAPQVFAEGPPLVAVSACEPGP